MRPHLGRFEKLCHCFTDDSVTGGEQLELLKETDLVVERPSLGQGKMLVVCKADEVDCVGTLPCCSSHRQCSHASLHVDMYSANTD